jgi:hypothetical protein
VPYARESTGVTEMRTKQSEKRLRVATVVSALKKGKGFPISLITIWDILSVSTYSKNMIIHQEPVTDYDEGMVRRLIERITVFGDHLEFEFKCGLETEVQM